MGNEQQGCCENNNNNQGDLNCYEDNNLQFQQQQQQMFVQQALNQSLIQQQQSSRLNQSNHSPSTLNQQTFQFQTPAQSVTFQQQIAATPRQDYNQLYQSQGARQEISVALQLSSNQTIPYHQSDPTSHPQYIQQLQQSITQQLVTPPQTSVPQQVNPNQSAIFQPTIQQGTFQQPIFQQQEQILEQQQFINQPQFQYDPQEYEMMQAQQQKMNEQIARKQQQKEEFEQEVKNTPSKQSLDEPILPQLYKYFIPIKNGDSNVFQDPYHGEINKLQSKLNPDFYLALKVLTYSNFKEFEQKEREFQALKVKFTHPHLINTHLIHSKKYLCLWTSTLRICLLKDFIQSNMWELSLIERLAEPQLWQLLDSVVDALQFLQLKQIPHGNVTLTHLLRVNLFDGQICYKLKFDEAEQPIIAQLVKNTNNVHPLKTSSGIVYLSPQLFKNLRSGQTSLSDEFKSDVYSLGMCLIHLALGPTQQGDLLSFYSLESYSMLDINIILKRLKPEMSPQLLGVLSGMVAEEESARPDFIQLYGTLRQMSDRRVFVANSPVNFLFTLDLQKRQEEKLIQSSHMKEHLKSQNKSLISPSVSAIQMQPSHFGQFNQKEKESLCELEQVYENFLKFENRHREEKIYPDGSVYKGEIQNTLKDGIGQMYYSDQTVYDGCWKLDQFHGKGSIYNALGVLIYEGNFHMGQFSQFGKLRNGKVHYVSGEIDYRDFTKLGNKWIKYEGDFVNGYKHGFGTLELSNGEKLVCQFMEDLPSGVGVFTTLSKRAINGQWNNGFLIRNL